MIGDLERKNALVLGGFEGAELPKHAWAYIVNRALKPRNFDSSSQPLTVPGNDMRLSIMTAVILVDLTPTGDYRNSPPYEETIRGVKEAVKKWECDIPVVAALVIPTWQQARDLFKAGASDVMMKSYSPDDVWRDLRSFFEETGENKKLSPDPWERYRRMQSRF